MKVVSRWVPRAGAIAALVLFGPGLAAARTLYYSGLLTNGGVTASGTHAITLRVWSAASGGSLICAESVNTGVTLDGGRFRLALAEGCTAALKTNPAAAVEVVVDGTSLGLSALGLVPYAVTAEQADVAQVAAGLSVPAAESLVLTGTILRFAGPKEKVPDGWKLCDGSQLPVASYQALWTVIGWAWGKPGNDSNYFNLPDLQGRFLRGVLNGAPAQRDPDAAAGPRRPRTGKGGNAVGSLQDHAVQSHTHSYLDSYAYSPGSSTDSVLGWVPLQLVADQSRTNGNSGNASTETRPLNVYVNFIIKT